MRTSPSCVLPLGFIAACGSNEISLKELATTDSAIARHQVGTHVTGPGLFGGGGALWHSDQVRIGPDPDPYGDRFDCSDATTSISAKLFGRELDVLAKCTHVIIETMRTIQDPSGELWLELEDGDDTWRISGLFRRYELQPEPPLGGDEVPKLRRTDHVKLRIHPPAGLARVHARIDRSSPLISLETTAEGDQVTVSLAGSTEGKTPIQVSATPVLGADECVGPSECRGVTVRTTVLVDVQRW